MKLAARTLAIVIFTAAIAIAAAGLTHSSAEAGPKGPGVGSLSGTDLGSGR